MMRYETRRALTEVEETRRDMSGDPVAFHATLQAAEELRLLAVQTRDEALARDRERFDSRWAFFFKCQGCGGRVEPEIVPPPPCQCGCRVIVTSGYSRP